jgi:alanine racemase
VSDSAARAGAVLEIDLAAIVRNWRSLQARLADGAVCAGVVKADAYGLGMGAIAPALAAAGCHLFFVATLDEGLALRRLLPNHEIAVLNGLLPGTAAEFIDHRLVPVLNDLGQVASWRGPGHPAMLHIDTGMARLGLPPGELRRLAEAPELIAGIPIRAIMSHLACADDPGHAMNASQLAAFRTALAALPWAPASLAASSGIFLGPEYHFAIARPGAAVYGVNPQPGHPNPMAQVVRLMGRIIQTREIGRGDSVGYGASYKARRRTRIATVAAGYADGVLRSLGNRGSARIGTTSVPIVGRVSMDLVTLDVTGVAAERTRPGELVELLGPDHGVDALAAEAKTIGYEILTALGRRYHRVHTGAP